jgi:SAM-dependent methyltransferase
MSFAVGTEAYDRFMGRYASPLTPVFADFASIAFGMRVLDVGCGPGALTSELVRRVGSSGVTAVDPQETFVISTHERHPSVDVRRAAAEQLPFEDRAFDATLAQLVVHFMQAPAVGLRELARVTRPRGVVAACVWDHEGGKGPLSLFWDAVRDTDPDAKGESGLAGAGKGQLGELLGEAGLHEIEERALSITVEHLTFEDWWEPFTLGVGPAGAYVAGLDNIQQDRLRERCRETVPPAPFVLTARAWSARGLAG